MNFKTIVAGSLAVVIAYSISAAVHIPTAEANYVSCEPYNSRWQYCTRTFWNPATGAWEQESYFAPYDNDVAIIDP